MSEHEGPEPRDCPACHEAHDTLPATPAASGDVDAAWAPDYEYPCIWCGKPMYWCTPDNRCCDFNDHPYRTIPEAVAAIRAESTPAASGDATPGEQMARDALIVASVTGSSQGVLSRATRQRLDDAIAAIRAESAGALDVGLLARAVGALDWEPFWTETDRDADGMIEVTFDHARFAERLAAEYARLVEDADASHS